MAERIWQQDASLISQANLIRVSSPRDGLPDSSDFNFRAFCEQVEVAAQHTLRNIAMAHLSWDQRSQSLTMAAPSPLAATTPRKPIAASLSLKDAGTFKSINQRINSDGKSNRVRKQLH